MKSIYLVLALLVTSPCSAAKREPAQTRSIAKEPQEAPSAEKIIYVPLWAITPDTTTNSTQDRNLFLAIMAIAGTMGTIMLDPTNSIAILDQVTSIVDNIAFAANATNGLSQRADKKSMIEALAKYIQEQAQLILKSPADQKEKNTESKSARDKLIEYALFDHQ